MTQPDDTAPIAWTDPEDNDRMFLRAVYSEESGSGHRHADASDIVAALRANPVALADVLEEFSWVEATWTGLFRSMQLRAEAAEERVKELETQLSASEQSREILATRLAECADIFDERGQRGLAQQYRSGLSSEFLEHFREGGTLAVLRSQLSAERIAREEVERKLRVAVEDCEHVCRVRDELTEKLKAAETELERALSAAAKRIGELEEAIADVADGFEQQGKCGIASQLRQYLPPASPPEVAKAAEGAPRAHLGELTLPQSEPDHLAIAKRSIRDGLWATATEHLMLHLEQQRQRPTHWQSPFTRDAVLDWLKVSWAEAPAGPVKDTLAQLLDTAGWRLFPAEEQPCTKEDR